MIPDCLRPDTNDADIWQQVYTDNEYGLGNLAGKVILDCGAHVGAFARRCYDNGAYHVVCVEPCRSSAALLAQILAPERQACRATVLLGAVWHHPGEGQLVHCRGGVHSGDTLVLHEGAGERCFLIPLDYLLQTHRPNVVKLDIEGAEYNILEQTPLPDFVHTLYVEFHEADHFLRRFVALLDRLDGQGFVPHLLREYLPFPERRPLSCMAYLYRFDRRAP